MLSSQNPKTRKNSAGEIRNSALTCCRCRKRKHRELSGASVPPYRRSSNSAKNKLESLRSVAGWTCCAWAIITRARQQQVRRIARKQWPNEGAEDGENMDCRRIPDDAPPALKTYCSAPLGRIQFRRAGSLRRVCPNDHLISNLEGHSIQARRRTSRVNHDSSFGTLSVAVISVSRLECQ